MRDKAIIDGVDFGPSAEMVSALEEDIIFGRIRPRERLTEDSLIARFGVKRHVAREALAALSHRGIVTRERNKGAVVREFPPEEVEQIYEMRENLHRWAAERIPLPAAPSVLARLKAIHVDYTAAVAEGALRRVYRLNNEFHDALFAAAGNSYLSEEISYFAWLSHAIRSYRIADPTLLAQAEVEHAGMIAALENGDRDELVRLCVEHIIPSKRAYLASVQLLVAATASD